MNTNPKKILLLSSSLLTDRTIHYTKWINELARNYDIEIWSTAAKITRDHINPAVRIYPFPKIRPFREFPYNYLRRINDYAWDFYLKSPSRISIIKHVKYRQKKFIIKILIAIAFITAKTRIIFIFERLIEFCLIHYSRSAESGSYFDNTPPDLIITTGPHRYEEPAVVGEARRRGIPILAMIHSWDNLSTKNRMVFRYDGYIVWSPQMGTDLYNFYPETRLRPVRIAGAGQFDVFFNTHFVQSRTEFYQQYGLDPNLPTIVYALGSPNFLQEHYGAIDLAQRLIDGELGDVQMIIRPHPLFDHGELIDRFIDTQRIVVQQTSAPELSVSTRFQDHDQVMNWVNTFRHADVVVNLSSTVSIDAALFDRPVVNLDYDPEPGQPNQNLVKDVNHVWSHFKPIAESGGVWLVNNPVELADAVRSYLIDPTQHHQQRCWIAEYVCGFTDGQSGLRLAAAVDELAQLLTATRVH